MNWDDGKPDFPHLFIGSLGRKSARQIPKYPKDYFYTFLIDFKSCFERGCGAGQYPDVSEYFLPLANKLDNFIVGPLEAQSGPTTNIFRA